MNEHDDFERTVTRSLRQRTERVSTLVPDLDGVWAQVDRRRSRRRHVAVVGSLAIVAVGAIGFASIGRGDPGRIPAPAAGAASDTQAAWRCTNQLDYFEERDLEEGSSAMFFETCEPVEVDGTVRVFDEPTGTTPQETVFVIDATVPITVPGSVAPIDGYCEEADSDGGNRVSVPCGTTPPMNQPATPTSEFDSVVDDPTLANTTTSISALSPTEQPYRIQAGDSLTGIAETFGITLDQLVNYNNFNDGVNHVLLVGDEVLIPPGASIMQKPPYVPTTTTSIP